MRQGHCTPEEKAELRAMLNRIRQEHEEKIRRGQRVLRFVLAPKTTYLERSAQE